MTDRQCTKQESGCELRALDVDCDAQGTINTGSESIPCTKYVSKSARVTEFKHPADDLLATCPSCESYTRFIFRGIQNDEKGNYAFPIYDCTVCRTTQSMRSLI